MKTECWIKIYPCGLSYPHGYASFVTSYYGSEVIRLIELPVHAKSSAWLSLPLLRLSRTDARQDYMQIRPSLRFRLCNRSCRLW